MNNDLGTLIEPVPVAFTWDAPGWYVLGSLLLLLMLIVGILVYRYYQKNKYRRSALSWLEAREKELFSRRRDELIYDAVFLMKRIAITRYGRREVAGVADKAWIAFLNQRCRNPLFNDNDADWLKDILYTPNCELKDSDARSFLTRTKQWIRLHRYAL